MTSSASWRGDPLPRGRHTLSADEVRASQRARLERAMLECVAELGYQATTVPEVVARARVSRNAFYEFFSDKTDCFIAVSDAAATEVLDELFKLAAEPSWTKALRDGMRVYLRWWRERPAFTRAYFMELAAAGAPAVAQRDRQYERFLDLFRGLAARARMEQPELPEISDAALRMLLWGTTELIASEARAGRVERLGELEDELVWVMLRMLADDATARAERDAVGARASKP
jgi:AcrR family transcriptional regulator